MVSTEYDTLNSPFRLKSDVSLTLTFIRKL